MNNVLKFSGMLILSALAFAGVYLLKVTLSQTFADKSNVATMFKGLPYLALNWRFWLAIFCYAAALGTYLFLLHNDDVSKTFAMAVGINIILTVLGSAMFLGDTLSVARVLGIFFIIVGIFIINGTK